MNLLSPLSGLYRLGDTLNKKNVKPRTISNAKVISVGNITTGGTGKTPAVMYFASLLQKDNYNVGILSRGYGGSMVRSGGIISDGQSIFVTPEESGDEPYLLASSLDGVPVAVGHKRYLSAEKMQEQFGTNLFILDDGFQHYPLYRDADIVLIDATNPFGNGHLLPRGILRELPEALRRSEIVILTKTDQASPADLEKLETTLKDISRHEMIFSSVHKPVGFVGLPADYSVPLSDRKMLKLDIIKNKSVWALSAIGSHRSFERSLLSLGAKTVESISFRDHHLYNDKDIENILRRIPRDAFIVTTEKDYVKLNRFAKQLSVFKIFFALRIRFSVNRNEILLREGLKARILAGKEFDPSRF